VSCAGLVPVTASRQVDRPLATGESPHVAGAFTPDGLGDWFVEGIEGDPSSVVGIGLPLLRRLLAEIGVPVHTSWFPTFHR